MPEPWVQRGLANCCAIKKRIRLAFSYNITKYANEDMEGIILHFKQEKQGRHHVQHDENLIPFRIIDLKQLLKCFIFHKRKSQFDSQSNSTLALLIVMPQ